MATSKLAFVGANPIHGSLLARVRYRRPTHASPDQRRRAAPSPLAGAAENAILWSRPNATGLPLDDGDDGAARTRGTVAALPMGFALARRGDGIGCTGPKAGAPCGESSTVQHRGLETELPAGT